MASYTKYTTAKGEMWRSAFRVIENGKLKQKTLRGYKTKKEAERAYIHYMEEYMPTTIERSQADTVTFGEALEVYLSQKKLSTKESTLYTNKVRFKAVLSTLDEDKKISMITPAFLMNWQESVINQYGVPYAIKLRDAVGSIIRFAHRFYGTDDAVLDAVERPKIVEKIEEQKINVWTADEYAKVRKYLDEPYLLYFDTLFFSGCRRSELTALQAEDVNFERGAIFIKQSLTRKVFNAPYKLTTPKNTQSVRWIALPDTIMLEIKQALAGRNKGFVFSLNNGLSPLSDTHTSRKFSQAIAKSGVKPIRIHDLRHSHASMLISQGVSVVAVSHRLGHSDIRETLNTYSHIMPTDNDRIESILKTEINAMKRDNIFDNKNIFCADFQHKK